MKEVREATIYVEDFRPIAEKILNFLRENTPKEMTDKDALILVTALDWCKTAVLQISGIELRADLERCGQDDCPACKIQ